MTKRILIAGARLLDPRQDRLGAPTDILISGADIQAVGQHITNAEDAERIDAEGLTVMPGLIDAHVHIYMNERNIAAGAEVPQTYAAAKSTFVLRDMLHRGWTTVRDVAGGDYGMRDAVEAGYVQSPRLFVGGKAITQTGGHGDFRGRAESEYDCACCTGRALFSTLADGVPEVIKATREQLRLGADHIKIMLSGGVASPNDPLDSIQYRVDEIAACVEEAQRWGTYVCAHAYSDIAIRRAVENGIRTIEHGNFVGAETAAIMAERGAFVVPTLIVHEANLRLGAASGKSPSSMEKNERVRQGGLQALKTYKQAGVQIGYGSDLSMHTQHFQNEGLAFHASSLSNADVIRSATIVNAKVIRREAKLGELVTGAMADVLLVKGDPYQDLMVLANPAENIVGILQSGNVIKNIIKTRNP
ncbi:metal-dependent hydrolase family protein [Ottowia thiooxydans]|uniref:metal-dependent hydrolase family protein n=1 Tax=Ottowia thiooxydans TaxID=219182 RepID=UPI0003F85F25|nr:amidohydrolase family protein [Ottowia thiooxydans]